jgi:hypothetical protein
LTIVEVDKNLIEELVDMKMKFLSEESDKILKKWNYDNPNKFLKDSENGVIREAENDAIVLIHLQDQREELLQMKRKWNRK